jgi:diguanylate cyclase (GGDEF)-like protein
MSPPRNPRYAAISPQGAETLGAALRVSGSGDVAARRAMRLRHWATAAAWTLAVAGSLAWNAHNAERQMLTRARAEAAAAYEKMSVLLHWTARQGGIYVAAAPAAAEPVLAHVPDHELVTCSGRRLALRSPGGLVRETMEEYARRTGVAGRITGLRQLNPANAPDAWERAQLEAFARGEREAVEEIRHIDGAPQLHLLRAWRMTPECEQCHAVLGYRAGELRGAMGVSLPLAGHYRDIAQARANLALAHGGLWLVGLFGIGWAARLEHAALRARLAAEANIRRLAFTDALTGLHSRASLENRLGQVLSMAQRERTPVALLFVDLDHFKRINDSLGHAVGDRLLRTTARRLRGLVRDSDIVARPGGDEFVVVLAGLDAESNALTVAGKILETLSEPLVIEGNTLRVTPSIGIALFPQDGDTPGELMKNADTAMYHAKASGRANVQFYCQEMNARSTWRLALESDLREALAADGLAVHYQPKVGAADGRLQGFEALLRWHHEQHGAIGPADFIPVAEESGLIEPLGDWVLDAVCRQLASWEQAGFSGLRVAINLSAQQLRSPELAGVVAATLRRHGVAPGRLEIEVTESTAMSDPERAIERLRELRAVGVSLAIDDFGTGHSSLAYLKRLPVQTLKIDRSFVMDIETDPNDAAIVAATLALARSLGLATVAEGVETAAQREFLVAHGCGALQGYLLGKPAPAQAWDDLLRAG